MFNRYQLLERLFRTANGRLTVAETLGQRVLTRLYGSA